MSADVIYLWQQMNPDRNKLPLEYESRPILEVFREQGRNDYKAGIWKTINELSWLKPLELIEYMAGFWEEKLKSGGEWE